jgi:alpha-tubulin suppressor-like RCC1 family protein
VDATTSTEDGRAAAEGGDDGGIGEGGEGDDADGASDAAGTCLSGMPCAPGSCQTGLTDCDASASACVRTSAASDGTGCDAGTDASAVCSQGACVSCPNGSDCSEAGSCETMTLVCATGKAVCTDLGPAKDGQPCGAGGNLFCNGGKCEPCTANANCVPADNACNKGIVSCSNGQVVCTDQKTAAADGTSCGTQHVCKSGGCVACASGVSCLPTNPCHTGVTSCASGSSVCVDTGAFQTNNTGCPSSNACFRSFTCQAGACTGSNPVVCTASDSCHVAGTCTAAGSTTSCSNPAAPNATSCGGSSECCTGACTTVQTDPQNCGGCGKACAGTCLGGSCYVATAIGSGDYTNCAVLAGGTVRCWGSNDFGQIGDGTTTDRPLPVAIAGLVGATAVAGGDGHTCAAVGSAAVAAECWGLGSSGQLGNGATPSSPVLTPTAVQGLNAPLLAMAAGGDTSCGLLNNSGAAGNLVYCWGSQNGAGTGTPSSTPLLALGQAVAVQLGENHGCAVTNTGSIECWGDNSFGQIGDGTTTTRPSPTFASLSGNAIAVAAGGQHSCAVVSGGAAYCWGNPNSGNDIGNPAAASPQTTPIAVQGLSGPVTAIAAGYAHTCALLQSGGVQCWGDNYYGELGNGAVGSNASNDSATPVAVKGLAGKVTALSAGWYNTCALVAGGAVQCWGDNANGDLGDGTTTQRSTPVTVQF